MGGEDIILPVCSEGLYVTGNCMSLGIKRGQAAVSKTESKHQSVEAGLMQEHDAKGAV